jgi:hypothetical protein
MLSTTDELCVTACLTLYRSMLLYLCLYLQKMLRYFSTPAELTQLLRSSSEQADPYGKLLQVNISRVLCLWYNLLNIEQ